MVFEELPQYGTGSRSWIGIRYAAHTKSVTLQGIQPLVEIDCAATAFRIKADTIEDAEIIAATVSLDGYEVAGTLLITAPAVLQTAEPPSTSPETPAAPVESTEPAVTEPRTRRRTTRKGAEK